MICGWTCFVATMFILANIIFTFLMDKHGEVAKYQKSLDEKQKEVYDKIVNERKNIALQGYGLGLGLSVGFLVSRHLMTKRKETFLGSSISTLCLTAAITFIVQYFYYILSPKSHWMLNQLTNEEQKQQWLKVYRAYSWNYHLSMLIGLIGAGLLGYGVC